jgi:hypothetical protein
MILEHQCQLLTLLLVLDLAHSFCCGKRSLTNLARRLCLPHEVLLRAADTVCSGLCSFVVVVRSYLVTSGLRR